MLQMTSMELQDLIDESIFISTEYQARQRQWDTAAADLAGVLAQIGVALGVANDSYRQVEQVNAARWR